MTHAHGRAACVLRRSGRARRAIWQHGEAMPRRVPRRSDAGGGGDQFAEDAASSPASAPGRAAGHRHRGRCMTCPASAKICRITCRSARSSRCTGVRDAQRHARIALRQGAMGLEYLLTRTGPMSMAPASSACSPARDPRLATADLEYHVQPLSTDRLGKPLHPFPAITDRVVQAAPESRGTMHAGPPDPMARRTIRLNYLGDAPRPRASSPAPSGHAPHRRRSQRWPPIRIGGKCCPARISQSDEDADAGARAKSARTIYHPVGTAAMGRADDPRAVVIPQLKVIGVEACASSTPRSCHASSRATPTPPTIMIAEKAAT